MWAGWLILNRLGSNFDLGGTCGNYTGRSPLGGVTSAKPIASGGEIGIWWGRDEQNLQFYREKLGTHKTWVNWHIFFSKLEMAIWRFHVVKFFVFFSSSVQRFVFLASFFFRENYGNPCSDVIHKHCSIVEPSPWRFDRRRPKMKRRHRPKR